MLKIGIVNYPGAMLTAVHGLNEMFIVANNICEQQAVNSRFSIELLDFDTEREEVVFMTDKQKRDQNCSPYQAIIIPPSISSDFYLNPNQKFLEWILKCHMEGSIVCSACAGAFILASAGLFYQRIITTHWVLAAQFSQVYPDIIVDIDKILINDGDIITAGGLMAWVDLGLELVAQFIHPNIMRQLGKYLVVDTGLREQRYYQSFTPKWDHGDKEILKVQQYLQTNFHGVISITNLSEICFLSERTFLRRFVKATGLKPTFYLQKLRVQKACDLIETTNHTFDIISLNVGYEDISSFRKVFIKIIGLTPREFKSRFGVCNGQ